MKYHVYTAIIYSQKSIIPKIIDSLVRAIAIKLTPKKKNHAPPPFHLPLKLIPYITILVPTRAEKTEQQQQQQKKQKSRNKAKHTSITSSRHPTTPFIPFPVSPFPQSVPDSTGPHHILPRLHPLTTPFSSGMQRVQAVNKENDDDTPQLEVFGKLNINEGNGNQVVRGSARAGPRIRRMWPLLARSGGAHVAGCTQHASHTRCTGVTRA